MKEKFDNFNNKVEKIINDVENVDEKTRKKLEEQVKKEFEEYKKDVLDDNVSLYDDKPFIQKLIFILVGVVFFPVGYALYFLINDNKKYKWQANYLVKASTVGLVLSIIGVVLEIISNFVEGIL